MQYCYQCIWNDQLISEIYLKRGYGNINIYIIYIYIYIRLPIFFFRILNQHTVGFTSICSLYIYIYIYIYISYHEISNDASNNWLQIFMIIKFLCHDSIKYTFMQNFLMSIYLIPYIYICVCVCVCVCVREHSGEGIYGCHSHNVKLLERIGHSGIR